jgi:hypothetical protein
VYKKFIHYCVVYAFGINYGAALRDATVSCQTRTAGGRRAVRSGRRLRGDTRSRCSLLGPRVSLHRGGGPRTGLHAAAVERSNALAPVSLSMADGALSSSARAPPPPAPNQHDSNTRATRGARQRYDTTDLPDVTDTYTII